MMGRRGPQPFHLPPNPNHPTCRDTIQLETAVSTISQEYLLEFTSEYGISEDVHPEFPGPEDRIVDFLEDMDLFNLISAPNPSKVKTGLRLRAAHEVPFLTATASRVIDMEDPDSVTESFGTPSAIEKSPLDFDNENPASPMTEGKGPEDQAQETVAPKISLPGNMHVAGAASEVREEEVAAMEPCFPAKNMVEGGMMRLMQMHHPKTAATPGAKHDPVAMSSQLRLRFKQEVMLLKKAKAQISRRDQRIQVREEEIKKLNQEIQGLQNQTSNLKTLLEAEMDMKKAAETKNADLTKELESLRTQVLDLQVSHDQLTQQVSTLQTQVTDKERIKAAFEEFKKYEDDRVKKRCTEMDTRLDALSIDFDEELYPYMLTAITGRRWAIRHGLRLVVMKCVESIKLSTPRDERSEVPNNGSAKEFKGCPNRAIAANMSHAEKKKKCRVVCRTHGIGSAHHVRSDGVSVSVPTVSPQGPAILLADVATQTETSEDDASPRLLRSKSLPPMYNLDWP
nr:hypothetical protein [Tanacetum cinerariifolium]